MSEHPQYLHMRGPTGNDQIQMAVRVAVFKPFPCRRLDSIEEIAPSAETLKLDARKRAVNGLFSRMSHILAIRLKNDMSRSNLLQIARIISDVKEIPIDRTAKRSRDGMICWLCEVAPELIDSPTLSLPPNRKPIPPVAIVETNRSDTDWNFANFSLDESLRKDEDAMLNAFFATC
jgi:hypothetical protein